MILCDGAIPTLPHGAFNLACDRHVTHQISVDELGKMVYLCASHAAIAEAGGVVSVVGLGGITVA